MVATGVGSGGVGFDMKEGGDVWEWLCGSGCVGVVVSCLWSIVG